MSTSKIEWTDKTWNPVTGCTKVSAGCKNCYAEGVANRFFARQYGTIGTASGINRTRQFTDVWVHEDRLGQPLRWRKPARIFVNSMSDLFHEDVPFEFIDSVFAVMALCPQHTFQILTKRPKRMREYCDFNHPGNKRIIDIRTATAPFIHFAHDKTAPYTFPLPNVWLGVSAEDQKTADQRIPTLLQTPAAVRFVSYEPALGPVDFRHVRPVPFPIDALTGRWGVPNQHGTQEPRLHWVIVGGESGPGARPFNIQWARDIIAQCKAASVPVFMKQIGSRFFTGRSLDEDLKNWPRWKELRVDGAVHGAAPLIPIDSKGGDWLEWPTDLRVREFPR